MATLLTHEWLAKAGGSENVFEQMGLALPEADQFCLWNDDRERFPKAQETWLGRSRLRGSKAAALPLLRSAIRSIPTDRYDTVLASSHAFGHYNASRAVKNGARGFAYVHSPARYIWAPAYDVRGQSAAVRAIAPMMRWLDKRTISSKVEYASNSEFVRRRIQDAWGVDSRVIHPPVAVQEIETALSTPMNQSDDQVAAALPTNYILGASRLVGYKRVDQVIELAASLGKSAVIAGEGPDLPKLHALAAKLDVRAVFVGRVSDRLLYELYRRADLFVFLAIEDFGIMPLEAISAGAPVLVNSTGGAWEGVGSTAAGIAVDATDWNSMIDRARAAMRMKDQAVPASVSHFSNLHFQRQIREWLDHG